MFVKSLRIGLAVLAVVWTLIPAVPARADPAVEAAQVPHLDSAGMEGYQAFLTAPSPRAFAIAPGGAWAWVSGGASVETAEAEALDACRQNTEQPCHLYAVDDQVILDRTVWAASWDLHMSAAQADAAPLGVRRGHRFPNLALTTPEGRPMTLSELRGKPVFLHFWGSWCPPCQTEFADLQKLYDALADAGGVTFVLVQSRESIAKSRQWTEKNGFTMPLYDSGHQGRADKAFRLADGTNLADRRLASVYPSTYVLDADGLVVFHRAGPGQRWEQYENLLRHIAPGRAH